MLWTTPKRTERISTLQLKTPSQIDLQNEPRVLEIQVVPKYLAKPETVNLVSEVLEGGQNRIQSLPPTTSSLVERAVRVRSLEKVVRMVKKLLRDDLGKARE